MRGKKHIAGLLFLLLGLSAGPATGPAAAWEFAYGPAFTWDHALRRVAPVATCPGLPPGYVAVGTKGQFSLDPDVYVVYTDLNGMPVWEQTFDVMGVHFEDDGIAIVEVPYQGFVFLSNVRKGGIWMPALTGIACDGRWQWSTVYPDVIGPFDLFGHDLIRARTGDPAYGTSPGDLVVAGHWAKSSTDDAFLLRTNPVGNQIWNAAYDTGSWEGFNGLTEAQPLPGQATGDLVAVGRYRKDLGLDQQGLVLRTSGDTGILGAPPHCARQHGATAEDEYNAVVELGATADSAGEFAIVGTTSDPLWADDVWVTRTTSCKLMAQSQIGDGSGVSVEQGLDIREVLDPASITPVGSLAIAGFSGLLGGSTDGALLFVSPGLAPIAGSLFGGAGPGNEVFYSLAENPAGGVHPPGYILAGRTGSDWAGVFDPEDVYLAYTNPLIPGCEAPWWPAYVPLAWPEIDLFLTWDKPAWQERVVTRQTGWYTPFQICP